jgi:hypothetical protein
MSTVIKPQQSDTPAYRPASPAYKAPAKTVQPKTEQTFLFDKENYMWMIGGVALIFIGFMLMSGGKSPNPHEFNYSEIYSFRRITVAPIVVLLGFVIEVYAIMKKPKDTTNEVV